MLRIFIFKKKFNMKSSPGIRYSTGHQNLDKTNYFFSKNTQHHPRQATSLRCLTGNKLVNSQSCITCDSQILSIIILTPKPFKIIWISNSNIYPVFQTVQQWSQCPGWRCQEMTPPLHSGARCCGVTSFCCQAMVPACLSPLRMSHGIHAPDGLEAAGPRGQPVQLCLQHVFWRLQGLSWIMTSRVVPSKSKINHYIIHSMVSQSSSGVTYIFLCCLKSPEGI